MASEVTLRKGKVREKAAEIGATISPRVRKAPFGSERNMQTAPEVTGGRSRASNVLAGWKEVEMQPEKKRGESAMARTNGRITAWGTPVGGEEKKGRTGS